ncbi:uncharacterized protein [Epargyreus clarus]|uniref:uncharacterized protein n=1 Tax=Epargyreus clarus TaxID=520877 RepID=UPI003C2F7644
MSDSSDMHSAGASHVTKRCRPQKPRGSTERETPTADAGKMSLKIPQFSPDDPEIWFALLEGQFENLGITDDNTKYNHVITNIEVRHAKTVKDIIVRPPAINRYDKIKTELIHRLSASHEKKVRQLLTHEELGDRKPTQFHRHLQDVARPSVPEDFLRSIWSSRLPHSLQTGLASQPSYSLDELADLADRVQEMTSPASYQVAATSTSGPYNSCRGEIAELRKMMEQLSTKVDRLTGDSCGCKHRSRSHRLSSRSPSRSRFRSQSSYRRQPLCYYHWKYGEKANKCQTPCDYRAGKGKSNQ